MKTIAMLFMFHIAVQPVLYAGEKTEPLSISVTVGDDLVPIVSLKNISDKDVCIIGDNGTWLAEHFVDVIRISVTPDLNRFGLTASDFFGETRNWQSLTLKPREIHTLAMPQLCGLLSVRKGEFNIVATYRTTEDHRNLLVATDRSRFALCSITSEPYRLRLDRPPFGVGKVPDPEKWALEHTAKNPFGGGDYSKQTLRLWIPNSAAGDASGIGARHVKGMPPTWTAHSFEVVTPILFRQTGIAIVLQWRFTSAQQMEKDPGLKELRLGKQTYPWLRHFGLSEEMEKKIENHRDFSFTRELDGVKIRYRVIVEPGFGALFEFWEEELDVVAPEIEQFLKILGRDTIELEHKVLKMKEDFEKHLK